jgi:hypothetical protein
MTMTPQPQRTPRSGQSSSSLLSSSIYPLHPEGSRVIFRLSEQDVTLVDRVIVAASSLFVVGAFAWAPFLSVYAIVRRWRSISLDKNNDTDDDDDDAATIRQLRRRRVRLASFVLVALGLVAYGPHRSPRFGRWLRIRHWKLWTCWLKFIAMQVIVDQTSAATTATTATTTERQRVFDATTDPAILAFCPHGIFPFAFAFGALPALASKAFGIFRPVVATATNFLPVVSDILLWLEKMYVPL